jgi:hypothetical protein
VTQKSPPPERWCRPDVRRFEPVRFSFALVELDLLLLLSDPGFLARLNLVGKISRPTAVRTFFEGLGGYPPSQTPVNKLRSALCVPAY